MNDFSNAFAQHVTITDDALVLDLADGRTISAPLAWYPRLFYGTAEERSHWRLIGHGEGISWTDLDEDISVANVLQGKPSRESPRSFARWIEQRKEFNIQRDQQPALEMEFAASIEQSRACGERG